VRRVQNVVALSAVFVLTAAPIQGPELSVVMQQKLLHAQKLLEALVTDDWVGLELQSREIEELTSDRRWMVLKYPEYRRYSATFVRAIEGLHTAAARRDVEATPKAYVAVTLQCVACHRYLARARFTQ
jgi:hypothetical protein